MDCFRDEIKKILLENLCIEFKDHEALSTLDTFQATIKLVEGRVDEVISKILQVFENR